MEGRYMSLILVLFSGLFNNPCYSQTDTLLQGQQFTDWDVLNSPNKVFSLKFFSFGTNISPYLGIFYVGYDKAVWVANRNNPITEKFSKLMIDVHGKLSISSGGVTVSDLFSPSPLVARNSSATLLDSGNFVLQELNPDGSVKLVLWQSFDYPTDALLPGMKLGVNHKTGHRWSLNSWRNDKLPSQGSFTLTGDPNGTSQMVIFRRGDIHWTSGSWRNGGFENTKLRYSGPAIRLYYISNETEQSFTYLTKTYESSPFIRIYPDGHLKGYTLNLDIQCQSIIDPGCTEYEFEKSKCRKYYHRFEKEYFGTYSKEYEYDESYNMSLYDCKRICWTNCLCTACSYTTNSKAGCKIYFGNGIYKLSNDHDVDFEYYRIVDRSGWYYSETEERKKKWIRLVIKIALVFIIVPLALLMSWYWFDIIKGKARKIQKLLLHQLTRFYDYVRTNKNLYTEVHYFSFQTLSLATNNFSSTNKLGEGGFGAVYKGKLGDGQEVAVKRLSSSSGQGVKEFKNEIELIAKLQHTNLVRLIGCCVEKKEKILVYEYMPNNSLDFFLFDPMKKGLLDWNTRYVIIDGIAQGLLYLHRFSRLRVIHRDLKASNILLDYYMKPKISDFGMAKLFGINESEANTSRVVGTRGYMSPEYLMEGTVSTKLDVFSFGVLLLEIVSSKMNLGSYDTEHPLNLLGHAWELWNKGKGLELMDPVLEDSCTPMEVMTCIHVGLLCVQYHPMDRPTMSQVISMLTNEHMHLPEPKQPAFFIERNEVQAARGDNLANGSINGQSISVLVAR